MSYLVLARKYRPQTFAEIVGQEHVTQTLQNAIATDRLHHAFLFTGARGVGKTTAARILAKALSCEKAPTPEPCNKCEACVEITQGSSVDVQEIDAASNNGVDNIRELREAIRYAPVRGKKKVYILDEVHMLSSGAWNALLKTLEEPPPHAVFVFATTDPHKLPATILSRVQRYDFKLVAARRIAEHLGEILSAEKIGHEPAALALIARESGGSVRDALSLLDQVIATVGNKKSDKLTERTVAELLGVADRKLLSDLADAIMKKDAAQALALVEAAFSRGYDLSHLSHAFLAHLRDLVVAGVVENPASLVDASDAELAALKEQAASLPRGLSEMLFQRFSRVTDEVARSPLPRYALEVGLIELTRIEPLEPLADLVKKLEALEGRVESGGSAPSTSGGGNSPAPERPRPTPQATAPAPTPAKAAPAAKPTNFTELVEQLMEKVPRLSVLALGRMISWTPDRLVLGFDKDFDAEQVRARLDILRDAMAALLGRAPDLEIRVGAQEDPSRSETLIEVEQRKIDEDRETRRKEALTHPARKLLDAQFGGTWREPVVDLDKE